MDEACDDGFEWDEAKRTRNIALHGIDFGDALMIWSGPVYQRRSDRDGEERWLAFGAWAGTILAVVWTPRGNRRRIISARIAHRHERKDYAASLE